MKTISMSTTLLGTTSAVESVKMFSQKLTRKKEIRKVKAMKIQKMTNMTRWKRSTPTTIYSMK